MKGDETYNSSYSIIFQIVKAMTRMTGVLSFSHGLRGKGKNRVFHVIHARRNKKGGTMLSLQLPLPSLAPH